MKLELFSSTGDLIWSVTADVIKETSNKDGKRVFSFYIISMGLDEILKKTITVFGEATLVLIDEDPEPRMEA